MKDFHSMKMYILKGEELFISSIPPFDSLFQDLLFEKFIIYISNIIIH
jgi:hypothetical protein